MMLYSFARPDRMIGHQFKDDVAVCRAISKKSAIKKFSKLYINVLETEVSRIYFRRKFPTILTDY